MSNNNFEFFDRNKENIDFLIQENWSEVWNFLRHNPELVKSNPKVKQAVTAHETLFFSDLENHLEGNINFDSLEIFYILHKRKFHLLSPDRFKLLVKKMITILKNVDLHKTYKLALNLPDDEICQTIIRDYEHFIPKKIAHSQNTVIQAIENKNLNVNDGRRSLFKSVQEKEFFDAVRQVYPESIVYPNVAIGSILNFESIKDSLSETERKYFFTAIVDCVVFDYQQLCLPKYFFELDSLYHDEPTQIRKDKYKDNIFSAAGQKLYRIRRISNSAKIVDFTRLIREVLDSTK